MIEVQLDLDRDRLHGFRRVRAIDDAGDTKELLYLHWSRDLRAQGIPTLVLDATVDERIVRRFFPRLDSIEAIKVATKHATVVQITDRVVSKAMLAPVLLGGRSCHEVGFSGLLFNHTQVGLRHACGL